VLSIKEHVDLRHFVRAKQHFLANNGRIAELLVATLAGLFSGLVSTLPNLPDTTDRTPPRGRSGAAISRHRVGYSRSRPRQTGAGTSRRPRPSGARGVAARYDEGGAALVRDWSLVIDTCPMTSRI
jgi:hypothetical protein